MKKKKWLRRRTTNSLLAISAIVILLAFLLSYSETGSSPQFFSQNQKPEQPNFYLTNTETSVYNQQGLIEGNITSERTEHNPEDDSAVMREPRIQLYENGIADWHISAQSGVLTNNGDKVTLNQRVIVLSSDQQTSLKTPQMVIYPNKKIAKTDKPVTLVNTNGFTRSIGLDANLRRNKIVLLSNVKGQYQPKVVSEYVE